MNLLRRHVAFAILLTALSVTVLAALVPGQAMAQKVDISGFVKASYYYDSRQIVSAREGDFVLYPAPEVDVDGQDQNATDNLLFFPLFSRLAFGVSDVPDVLGATVTGRIEGDFHGASNALLNSFRIRRSFVKFDWGRHAALFGMEWSPTFLDMWPRTAATEAGVPFHCFARLPQARYTFQADSGFQMKLLVAQQRDAFAELSGLKTAQQAGLPMLMAFAQIDRGPLLIGGGTWTKWVRPTLTDKRFNAMAYQGFLTVTTEPVTLRAKVTYGEDLADQIMTGGFLVQDDGEPISLNTLAYWGELSTNNEGFNVGVFGGFYTNLGAGEDVQIATFVTDDPSEAGDPDRNVFARGANIDRGFRVAPRATYDTGRVRFALEFQYDDALYASAFDTEYAPDPQDEDESVANFRTDFSVFLFF